MSKTINDKVSWVLIDEGVLQLESESEHRNVDKKVLDFMVSKGLDKKEDYPVSVEIEGDKIVKLVLSDKKDKSSAPKEDVEQTETTDEKITDVIVGVSVKNKGVKLEQDKDNKSKWYTLSDELDASVVKGYQGKKVELEVKRKDKGNDIINSVTVVEQEKEEDDQSKIKNSFVKSSTSSTQVSIEAQVAVEHAQILAASLVNAGILKNTDTVNEFVNSRAEENYNLMQSFKKGK